MDSSKVRSRLTPLQRRILVEFFRIERGFFLTGGAALAGFHLGHRATDDLDLFTLDREAFERGRHDVPAVASSVGATVSVLRDAPGYRRYALATTDETVVVDLVLERVPQLHAEKPVIDGIVVDPPDEIFANKLTALVGRMEERDLIDVLFLEQSGLSLQHHLPVALSKDGGATPATLAWLLSEVRVPDEAALPAGVTPAQLRAYLEDLVVRLRAAALPR